MRLSKVVAALNLVEKDYFGLSYRDEEDARCWLYKDKRVLKQMKDRDLIFYFEVRRIDLEQICWHIPTSYWLRQWDQKSSLFRDP